MDAYVGRQPIYDADLNVFGYELLFRNFGDDEAKFVDGDSATSRVILNTFMEIGLEHLVGNGLAFINLTRNFVVAQHPLPLPRDNVVLEILEDIVIDDEIINAVRHLKDSGYVVALDDIVDPVKAAPLLDMADLVKMDIMGMAPDDLERHVEYLKQYDLKLLAEKVEVQEEFDHCKQLGFDYFQGYFLSKPNVVQGRQIAAARINILNLLAKLQSPDVEFEDLEEVVRQDVSLSYKLLRLTNSALYSKPTDIKTIGQALTYLGLRQVQSWVSLLLLSNIDDKPSSLMKIAMTRAKMCEILAQAMNKKITGPGFTVGLFSAMDAIFDRPLEDILEPLPLAQEIKEALLNHEGRLGQILRCALIYERGDWDELEQLDLDPDLIRNAYLDALKWVDGAMMSMAA